jgi:hypothetical protein
MEQLISDLEIELSARSADSYSIALRFVAAGSDSEQRLLKDDASTIEQSRFAVLKDLPPGSEAYAKSLSEAFFSNPLVAVAFEKAASSSEALNSLLRIRLLLAPNRPELHDIHWECLRDLHGNSIATDRRNLFSRYLPSLDWQPPRHTSAANIKVLVTIANPSNLADFSLAPIDSKAELANIKSALPNTSIEVLENPTIAIFSAKLAEDYDLVYLVCHGAMVDQKPVLMLCDGQGKVDIASGEQLAGFIKDLESAPRLIVLASCQSAVGLGSLAPMLCEAGVPAILAMNGNFSMAANATFMPRFFRALGEEGLIDKAMSVARGALRGDSEAWMPVLYMRLRTGQLLQTNPPPAPTPQIVYVVEQPKPKRRLLWWTGIYNWGTTNEFNHLDFYLETEAPAEILASEKTFLKTDRVGIHVIIPKQGYFYAFNRYEDGRYEILFPAKGASSVVAKDQRLRFPSDKTSWLSGRSATITLVWSQDVRNDLLDAIKDSDTNANGIQIISQPAPTQSLESDLIDLTASTRREVVTTPAPLSKLVAQDFHVAYTFRIDFN